jgi:hypothetical protein
MCARIQISWYVAGRRIKVVPRYALGFHLDAPPGSGALAFRISRVENCSLIKAIRISAWRSVSGFQEPQVGLARFFLPCSFLSRHKIYSPDRPMK